MKFLHLNVNSIQKYKHELLTTFHDIGCFSLNETKLSSSVVSFSLPGCIIFRSDRNTAGGGVLIAIKHVHQSILLEKGSLGDNEYVIVECKRHNQMPLTIASIYVPPQRSICSELLNKTLSFNNNLLILGDFNANHIELDCKKTN